MKRFLRMQIFFGILLLNVSAILYRTLTLQDVIDRVFQKMIPSDECAQLPAEVIGGCTIHGINSDSHSISPPKDSSSEESGEVKDTKNTYCYIRTFLSSNFSIHLDPGNSFQHLQVEIYTKTSLMETLHVLPVHLPQGEWRKLTLRYDSKYKVYYLLVDGKEIIRTEKGIQKGDFFMLRVYGGLQWSLECDPLSSWSGAAVLLPWMLFLLMTLVVVGMVVFVLLQKRKQRLSLNLNELQQRPPIAVPEQPRPFQGVSHHPEMCSNPEDYIYEELPERASSRGSAFSTANSLYARF